VNKTSHQYFTKKCSTECRKRSRRKPWNFARKSDFKQRRQPGVWVWQQV